MIARAAVNRARLSTSARTTFPACHCPGWTAGSGTTVTRVSLCLDGDARTRSLPVIDVLRDDQHPTPAATGELAERHSRRLNDAEQDILAARRAQVDPIPYSGARGPPPHQDRVFGAGNRDVS